VKLPAELLAYVLAFIAIPLLSIVWYCVIDGRVPFEGFQLFKGYLLISLALLLVLNRIDLVPQLSAVLIGVVVPGILLFVYLGYYPGEYENVKKLADPTGSLILDRRRFGEHIELLQVYLVTSPLLLFSFAYYFHRAMTGEDRQRQAVFWGLVGLSLAGILVGGTRNNILGGLLLPFLLWPLYTRNVTRSFIVSGVLLSICALVFVAQLRAFFDLHEAANNFKLELLRDYREMFVSDPVTLWFGRGLGAHQYWGARRGDFYISELTYLEMVRNFGLIGAIAMMTLLLAPIPLAFATGSQRQRALALSYGLYLVMCATNPNLFSSMGILILSILLANAAMERPLSSLESRLACLS
jgi:hypothetical protein